MNIALLKNRSDEPSITTQQKQIVRYAHHNSLLIKTTEIENSPANLALVNRKEFKGFLRSLEEKDHLLIYDLSTFSNSIEELVKIFECLLTRDISVHITESNTLIDAQSKPLLLLEILTKHKELTKNQEKERAQGRPKGRMSKSKFDIYRPKIIELLEAKNSVSEIAKLLEVSRTSLKDYINSRGLKELVKAKVSLLKGGKKAPSPIKTPLSKECSLIHDISQSNEEGTTYAV